MYAEGDLVINSGTVNATGEDATDESYGIKVAFGSGDRDITINGGTVRANSGEGAMVVGIGATGDFYMTGGTLEASSDKAVEQSLALMYHGATISGGTITAVADEAPMSIGLAGADGDTTIKNATVTVSAYGGESAVMTLKGVINIDSGAAITGAAGGFVSGTSDTMSQAGADPIVITCPITSPHTNHPICGTTCSHDTDSETEGAQPHGIATYLPWTGADMDSETDGIQIPAGNYYLAANTPPSDEVYITGDVNLCLNGFKFEDCKAIYVSSGNEFNICDCGNGGGIVFGASQGISNRGGTVNIYGGTFTGSSQCIGNSDGVINVYGGTVSADAGYGIDSSSGTVNIYGGTVSTTAYGDPAIKANGTVNIYGGTVSVTANNGTAIEAEGTVNIYGGTVTGTMCGVAVDADTSTLNITGGTIKGTDNENAIAVASYGAINISGSPTITGTTLGVGCYSSNRTTKISGTPNIPGGTTYGDVGATGAGTLDFENYTGKALKINCAWEPKIGDVVVKYASVTAGHSVTNEGFTLAEAKDGDKTNLVIAEYAITQQPTSANDYTVAANGTPTSYKWYKAEESTAVVDETNATGFHGESVYDQTTESWSAYKISGSTWAYFEMDLVAGDILNVTLDEEIASGDVCLYGEIFTPADGVTEENYTNLSQEFTFTITEENAGKRYLEIEGYDGIVKATVTRKGAGDKIPGQTASALSTDGLASGEYVCKVTYSDGTVLTSDIVTYIAAYTAETDTRNLVNATATLSKTTDIAKDESITLTITPNSSCRFETKPTVSATNATIGELTSNGGKYICTISNFTADSVITISGAAVKYTNYVISEYNLDHVNEVLSGIATATESNGVITIKFIENVYGRISFGSSEIFEQMNGSFVIGLNGKTIDPGTTNEALCLDNGFGGTVTVTGNGTMLKGENFIIYKGSFGNLKFDVSDGNNYFEYALTDNNGDVSAEKNIAQKTIGGSLDGKSLTITHGNLPTYKVIFNANGGTGTMDEQTFIEGFAATLTQNAFAREGYTFLGWSENATATTATYEDKESVTLTENKTLYAVWKINTYTVTWKNEDGTELEKDENVEYGATPTYDGETPTKVADAQFTYAFTGWDPVISTVTGNVTYTAQFSSTVNKYTVTWKNEDGTELEKDENVEYGATPEYNGTTPTKTGYTFNSWDNEITAVTGNVTYTATWTINQYTITFDTDGGSAIAPITQNYNTAVTAPAAPTKTGYTFAGWDVNVPATMPAEDVTITAQWTINQYTITFADTGDTTIAPITQDYNSAVTAPADPTKTGYTFAGWSESIPTTMPAGNKTITATWTINQYTITFADTGDTTIAPITQDYNTAVTAPADLTKTGYTFAGWDVSVPATMPAENKTITANWTINQYTITFDTDGGSVINPITQDYNSTVTAPKNPTKAGYNFVEWVDSEGNAITVPATMPAENITLKAIWQRRSSGGGVTRYTVKFDTDGGSTVANKTVSRNSKVAEPTAPTKEGYTFMGWFADDELTTAYDFASPVTKNITLYAKWEKHDDEQTGTGTDECDGTKADNCPAVEFSDVDTKAWYHLNIDYVLENSLMKGVANDKFAPNDSLTRAMLVTILYRAEGEPKVSGITSYSDLEPNQYYLDAVCWAQINGIVNGTSKTTFAPNSNITREQIAAIFYRYRVFKGMDAVNLSENLGFADADDISSYAISAMNWAVGTGLIKGYENNTVRPQVSATRAEAAALLQRFLEANK